MIRMYINALLARMNNETSYIRFVQLMVADFKRISVLRRAIGVYAFEGIHEDIRMNHSTSAYISNDHRRMVIYILGPPNPIQGFIPAVPKPILIKPLYHTLMLVI
jgi:hypothetical protein